MSKQTSKNRELTESELENASGGLTVDSFETRGSTDGKLAKISGDDGSTLSEFVPKLTSR